MRLSPSASAVAIAVGLTLGGGLIGRGFARGRAAEPYVEVKGQAEQKLGCERGVSAA